MKTISCNQELEEIQTLVADLVQPLVDPALPQIELFDRVRGPLSKTELDRVGFSETAGGSGGGPAEAAEIVRALGYQGVVGTVPETVWLAGWLADSAGLVVPPGMVTAAHTKRVTMEAKSEGTLRVTGTADFVPWCVESDVVVLLAESATSAWCVTVAVDDVRERVLNVAGEPSDRVSFDIAAERDSWAPVSARTVAEYASRRLIMNATGILGAMQRAINETVDYVAQREQFGRTLASFQVVRHQLAILAGKAAMTHVAVQRAVDAIASEDCAPSTLHVHALTAKWMAANAAGDVAATAHQLHGGIGFSAEHPLHLATRRLWAWRDRDCTESEAELALGCALATVSDVWVKVAPR